MDVGALLHDRQQVMTAPARIARMINNMLLTISRRARLAFMSPLVAMSRLPWRTVGILILTSAAVSCTPAAEAPVAADAAAPNPVAQFIATKMQPGPAAFVIPSPISRGESVEAMLELGALGINPQEIQRDLKIALDRPTTGESAQIDLAHRIAVRLSTIEPGAAVIAPNERVFRAVPFNQSVRWTWSVTPIRGGDLRFQAVIEAMVNIDNLETPYHVRSFQKVVTVTVSPAQRVGDVSGWIVENWEVPSGVVAALAALVGWIMRRRRRMRSGGARPSSNESR